MRVYVDRCNSTQFHCLRGNSCISAEQECDGVTHCNDTSDEAKCGMLYACVGENNTEVMTGRPTCGFK